MARHWSCQNSKNMDIINKLQSTDKDKILNALQELEQIGKLDKFKSLGYKLPILTKKEQNLNDIAESILRFTTSYNQNKLDNFWEQRPKNINPEFYESEFDTCLYWVNAYKQDLKKLEL